MRRFYSLLLAFALALSLAATAACKEEEELASREEVTATLEFSYSSDGNTYEVAGASPSYATKAEIPSEYKGRSVTAIKTGAFEDFTKLRSVVMTKNIKKIGDNAFARCTSLETVVIGDAVTSVGEGAFSNCGSLYGATIGENVSSIGDMAFMGCNKLIEVCNRSSLDIKAGNTSYGYAGYYAKNIYTPTEERSKLSRKDGFVFFEDTDRMINRLVAYTGNSVKLRLPDSVNGRDYAVGDFAFCDCDWLLSIDISSGVISIGEKSFADCNSLIKVSLGKKLKTISDSAFAFCGKIIEVYNASDLKVEAGAETCGGVAVNAKNVYTPSSGRSRLSSTDDNFIVYKSDDENFLVAYTGREKNITLPAYIDNFSYYIYDYAFYDMTRVTQITLSKNTKGIGAYAFAQCSLLTEIELPDRTTSVGRGAFYGCTADIVWGQSSLMTAVSDGMFEGYAGKNLTLPDGITSIGDNAFSFCAFLESLKIGSAMTEIGAQAFYGCGSLRYVYYTGGAAEWAGVTVQSGNNALNADTLYFYRSYEPILSGNYWHYAADGVTPVIW